MQAVLMAAAPGAERALLCHSVTTGGNQMSEAEMDVHTISGLREEAAQEGRPPKALVSLHPGNYLSTVLQKLFRNRCSMAPVLTGPSTGVPTLLQTAPGRK